MQIWLTSWRVHVKTMCPPWMSVGRGSAVGVGVKAGTFTLAGFMFKGKRYGLIREKRAIRAARMSRLTGSLPEVRRSRLKSLERRLMGTWGIAGLRLSDAAVLRAVNSLREASG